ncbi:hypothetical protein GCG54_00001469 [Colletotrichum gloeosporioides]|uniref:Uncharacterized protein n=1 Tax=Colletotrichum gloeosporioides TaxID=474922 RepID=A0A8H4CW93_COLGL|nr:uncharacterized protein GCG54_00001469 [Colletotrichum gloeosporioides]KAF3811155.1 hypothetical protein GCG54_00001469 [Colletotrichum gloeosporioides]
MAYEDPDKFISDSTLFFLPGAMILWLLIFMIVTLSYSVNSPPKIMPRAVNLGLVGVASVFMGLWLLGLMVCYCRGTFLKGRSGRDVAPKPPGWGEDMEKRMYSGMSGYCVSRSLFKSSPCRSQFILRIFRRFILSNFQHNYSLLDSNKFIHTQYNQNLCSDTSPSDHTLSSNPNNKPIKTVYNAIIQDPCLTDRGICPRPSTNLATANQYPDYDVPSSSLIKPASEGPVDRAGSLREPWLAAERKSESPTGFRQFETESQFTSSRRGLAERKALGACSRPSQTICTE